MALVEWQELNLSVSSSLGALLIICGFNALCSFLIRENSSWWRRTELNSSVFFLYFLLLLRSNIPPPPFFKSYLFLAALDLRCCVGFCLVVAIRGYSLVVVCGLLIAVASCCRAWALGMLAQQLWCTGLVALQHVESPRTRNQTHIPCISRFLTTGSPGKSFLQLLNVFLFWARPFCFGLYLTGEFVQS